MSNKRKPGKKHNAIKRMQTLLSDVRMWCWQSDFTDDGKTAYTIEARLHRLMPYKQLGKDLEPGMVGYPFNWKICARALCTNGNDYWLETVDRVIYNTVISKVVDVYREMEREAVNAQQSKQIVDVGWIAQTFYKNPDFKKNWEYAHIGELTEQRQWLYRLAKLEQEAA